MSAQPLQSIHEWLAKLVQVPGELGDIRGTLQHIVEVAHRCFGADVSAAFAVHFVTGRFMSMQPTIVAGELQGSIPASLPPRSDGLTRDVLKIGMLLVTDLQAEPHYQRPFTQAEGINSFAAFALTTKYRKRPMAVLYLNFRQRRHFSNDDQLFFQIFATQAAFVLQEAWNQKRQRDVLRLGLEINHGFSTFAGLFQRLQKYINNIVDTSSTFLLVVYHQQSAALSLFPQNEHGVSPWQGHALEELCHQVIRSQHPIFAHHLSLENDTPLLKRNAALLADLKESLILFPLVHNDLSLGAFVFHHPQPDIYSKLDVFLIQLIANHVANAIHHMRLYTNMSQLNETGQLLNQQLEPTRTLQATVDNIYKSTKADLVALFPYNLSLRQFLLPPYVSGELLAASSLEKLSSSAQSSSVVELLLQYEKPILARKSATLYSELFGDERVPADTFEGGEKMRSTAALPLRLNEETVGILLLYFRQPQRFDSAQTLLISGLGLYATTAVKNAQTVGSIIQHHTRELDILQDVDRELNRTLELQPVLDVILKHACQQINAEAAIVLLYDPEIQVLERAAVYGPYSQKQMTSVIPLQENKGIVLWVLTRKQAALVNNVRERPWRDLYMEANSDTVSELAVPLFDGDDIVGVLNFESTKEGAFNQNDQAFLLTLAGQAVLAIKNAQAYEREKRLVAEGQVLNEISKQITRHLDLAHVFDLILDKALELTHSHQGILLLYDAELDSMWIAKERGVSDDMKNQRISLEQGIVGYAARNKETLNVDPSQEPWSDIKLDFIPDTRSVLAVPMLAGEEIRGVLDVESSLPKNFKERDVRLLKALADLAVVALQNAERYEKAEKEALRFSQLYQAGQDLSNINELEQIEQAYKGIRHLAERQHPGCTVVVRRYHDETQELTVVGDAPPTNVNAPSWPHHGSIIEQAYSDRRTIMIYDAANLSLESERTPRPDPVVRSLVIVHIQFKDRYYGTLELGHETTGHFRPTDQHFLELLAQQLASALYRLQAIHDRQEFEKRAAVAEEMSSIGQSAFELSHRLGNDLGLIPTYVEMAQEALNSLLVHEVNQKLLSIKHDVEKVLHLNGKLKTDLANDDAHGKVEFVLVPPNVLFEDTLTTVKIPPTVSYKLEVENDVGMVSVMYNLITDVLRNLIVNALEAMRNQGSLALSIRNQGRYVALEVCDSGPGIPKDMHTKIFELFCSTKHSSGFGLWSARRNAVRNNGELRVDSVPGRGATFTLLLPKANGEEGVILL